MVAKHLTDPPPRFYVKQGPAEWGAFKYSPDEHPDWHIGDYGTRDEAVAACNEVDAAEAERYGVWRFFAE
ncbi:hypothetical protein NIIDNTM18_42410 [Mycolicibacterium litorale]|uniref:DUF1508 domain-containing protein n=1 Tax=Mycolicibacterium litorale TaxID=758802 RepID=A0A6S6P526_9MYCO|nr:hypothetical protein [Mycolicibacterium litorale]BCI54963.1 hypothetical protein NIIDNTM18_42410 [Mycolicibacterium litorale]